MTLRTTKYILLLAVLMIGAGRLTEWADAMNYPSPPPAHQRAAGHGYVLAPGQIDYKTVEAAVRVSCKATRECR